MQDDKIFVPTDMEAAAMLRQVKSWVKGLTELGVGPDTSCVVARDFLRPRWYKNGEELTGAESFDLESHSGIAARTEITDGDSGFIVGRDGNELNRDEH